MEFTANTTVLLVKLTGIPVYQEGFNFILPSGNWSVVEECSGVRYLIATVTLGIVYSYITYASLKKRLVFTFFAIITPIIANSLRAFIIVLLGHFSGMTIATGADHLLYGWVLFGIIIITIFYIGSFWRDSEEEFDKSVPAPGPATSATSPVIYLIAGLVVISTLPYMLHQANSLNKNPSGPIELLHDASELGHWHRTDKDPVWNPIVYQPDHLLSAGYSSNLGEVQLDIGYFHSQREGHETVSSNNKLVNQYGGTWKIVTASVSSTTDSSINESVIMAPGHKLLIWQWYRIGELQTHDPYLAKIYEAYMRLAKGRNDGAYITLSTVLSYDKDIARTRLSSFYNQSVGIINHGLDELQKNN
jgi:EpsI family protein